MSDLPCPKCGGKMDGVGVKLVCGDCYHVVDQNAPPPAPKPAKDPNAPLPSFASDAPAAALPPGICPKCNGPTSDVGGRLVCSNCYWVVDGPRTATLPLPTSQTAAPGGFTMMHFGVIFTVICLMILVFMVQFLNKQPPPSMNSQQLPFGIHPRTGAGAPVSVPASTPNSAMPVSPTAAAPVGQPGMPPQGVQPQMPPSIVPQGGVTSPQAQPQLPPTIVPQGGVGVDKQ